MPGLAKIERLISDHPVPQAGMQAVVSYLREQVSHYDWVGIYLVKGGKLHLTAWDGPEATEHTSIDIGTGICGLAARSKQTVVVGDVNAHKEYLACFPYTRSEIVVPLMLGDCCVGEIDIDSATPQAFTAEDCRFLEQVAQALVKAYFEERG